MDLSLIDICDLMSCIFLAIIFSILTELKYSKKTTFILLVAFIVITFSAFLKLVFIGINEGYSSAITFTIPSLFFCLLLSKNKDSRFIFNFCSIDIMGLIIVILSRAIAILFDDNPIIILLLTLLGFFFLLFIALKYRRQYIHLQRTFQTGWRSFAAVSVLFYIMIYLIIAYPAPMIERREYLPVAIFFSITVIFVYLVIYQTLVKTVIIHDKQKDRVLLETKIALQNSQLELKEMYYKMAYTDALTGLKNRTAFEERKETLKKNIKNESMLACLSMDLNNLKEINDLCGHNMGDELIKSFSNVLKHSFDDSQNIYRIGGDEFVIFFSGNSSDEIKKQIVHLKQQIAFYNKHHELQISIAMGLVFMNEDHINDINTLMLCADERMYENKKALKKRQLDAQKAVTNIVIEK